MAKKTTRTKKAARTPVAARAKTARKARPAKKAAPARAAARKAKRSTKKAVSRAAKPSKAVTRARKPAPAKAPARRPAAAGRGPARKSAPATKTPARKAASAKAGSTRVPPAKLARAKAAPAKAAPKAKAATNPTVPPQARTAPGLARERRTVDAGAPSSLGTPRHASAAASGAEELRVRLASYTGSGPEITAGDVDANWEAAESVGDEAPGGDNPTPDQDVVDEIGRALGIEYDDDEELQGGDEIAARDHDRWELDPASSDDFDER